MLIEKILPVPPDQLEAVHENQRSVESALDLGGCRSPNTTTSTAVHDRPGTLMLRLATMFGQS